jgi:GNAT superfamily N-acetyltransferase
VSGIVIRAAVPEDAAEIMAMITELAVFERAPEAVHATEADLLRDGWGDRPVFEALMAEIDGSPVGFALFFPKYSTWEGCAGLYIEDLYVRPTARGRGVGGALIARVAALTVERGGKRLDLSVLHWNPAREVYAALGFVHLEEWRSFRLEGEALLRLSDRAA